MVICRNNITLSVCIKKIKKHHTSNLTTHMKALEQKEEAIPKRSRQEGTVTAMLKLTKYRESLKPKIRYINAYSNVTQLKPRERYWSSSWRPDNQSSPSRCKSYFCKDEMTILSPCILRDNASPESPGVSALRSCLFPPYIPFSAQPCPSCLHLPSVEIKGMWPQVLGLKSWAVTQ